MELQNNTDYEITLDYMQLTIKIDGVDQVFACEEELYENLPQPETLEDAEDLRMNLLTDASQIGLEIAIYGEILLPAAAWFGEERLMEDWDWDAATIIIDEIEDTSW